jgi:predicted transglutaminase-like cysteine proteinase
MELLYDTLKKVFEEEISRFIYKTDQAVYKMPDKWIDEKDIPLIPNKFIGDCEDFALACRKNLRNLNINHSRLVLCLTKEHEYHMVLEIEGWILDCLQTSVISRQKTGYGWIMISGENPGDPWRSLV